MRMNCPHCTLVAIGPDEPRTVSQNAFWILSRHVNRHHRKDTFLCQRRTDLAQPGSFTSRDFWRTEPNGDRTCSCCGSLHEDDFRAILEGFVEGKQGYLFTITDKSDKVYASRPGVRNSRDGGTKFYLQHGATLARTLGALIEQALRRLPPAATSSE